MCDIAYLESREELKVLVLTFLHLECPDRTPISVRAVSSFTSCQPSGTIHSKCLKYT